MARRKGLPSRLSSLERQYRHAVSKESLTPVTLDGDIRADACRQQRIETRVTPSGDITPIRRLFTVNNRVPLPAQRQKRVARDTNLRPTSPVARPFSTSKRVHSLIRGARKPGKNSPKSVSPTARRALLERCLQINRKDHQVIRRDKNDRNRPPNTHLPSALRQSLEARTPDPKHPKTDN